MKGRPGSNRRRPKPKAEIEVFDPEEVVAAMAAWPSDDEVDQIADVFAAIGQPSRLKALIALSTHELCVGDLAQMLGLSLSATSTLLKRLRLAGLVESRSAGKQTYYGVSSDLPAALLAPLLD